MKTVVPRYFRHPAYHIIGWEIFSRKEFYITFSLGKLEIQINRWPSTGG